MTRASRWLLGGLAALLTFASWRVSGLFYTILALLLPVAVILLTKLIQKTLDADTGDAFKILLGALSVSAILFWVLQGSLSTRLDIRLAGQVNQVSSPEKRQVVASLRVANVGANNVSVESATMTIVPKTNGFQQGKSEFLSVADLNFKAGKNKDSIAVKLGMDGGKYFLTWGTEETRQVSRVLAAADYYEIQVEMEAAQRFPRSVSTWRAVAVVPTGKEMGRSPAFDEPEKGKSQGEGLLDTLIKKLRGE